MARETRTESHSKVLLQKLRIHSQALYYNDKILSTQANHILNVVTFLSDCESGAIKQNILQNSLSNRITHSEGLHLTESISQEDWLHIRSIWKRKEPMTVLDDVVEQLQSRFDQYHVYVSTFRRLLQYSGDHLKDQILTRQSEIQEMLLKESCVSTSTASRMRNRVRRQARATQLKDFEVRGVS